jgi:hypothetical protein
MKPASWLLVGALALLPMSAGCKARPVPAPTPPPARPIASAPAGKILIVAQGKAVAELTRQGPDWRLTPDGAPVVTCRAHDPSKRYCQTADGTRVAEVKAHGGQPGDDGGSLKLLDSDGKLRWKLRYDADKLKLSDNEDNRNPWTISLKHGDKLKVSNPDQQDVGVLRRGGSQPARVEGPGGEKLFTVEGAATSAAGALLLVPALGPRDRLILMAALLDRGL